MMLKFTTAKGKCGDHMLPVSAVDGANQWGYAGLPSFLVPQCSSCRFFHFNLDHLPGIRSSVFSNPERQRLGSTVRQGWAKWIKMVLQ